MVFRSAKLVVGIGLGRVLVSFGVWCKFSFDVFFYSLVGVMNVGVF